MSRQIFVGLGIVILLSVCLMVGGATGSTQSKATDPSCSGMPPTDLDEFVGWMERCGAPTCDASRTGIYTDDDKGCIRVIEYCDDEGNPRIVFKPCKKRVLPLPNIAVLTVHKGTYRVDVARPKKKEKPHTLGPDQVKLAALVRAMAHGSQLPSEDLLQVPQEFWTNQPKLVLKKKAEK